MHVYCLALLFSAASASAQPPADTTAHAIPFGAVGNTLELAVANAAPEASLDSVSVLLVSAPSWLLFEQSEASVGRVVPGAEAVAAFAFDVDRAAPVGETAEVLFRIESASGQVWTKTVRLQVEAPRVFVLEAAYPNPFRTSATLAFQLPAPGRVRLSVFDMLGREVSRLADGPAAAGRHEVVWPASGLSSGVYVYRITVEDEQGQRAVRHQRLTLLR